MTRRSFWELDADTLQWSLTIRDAQPDERIWGEATHGISPVREIVFLTGLEEIGDLRIWSMVRGRPSLETMVGCRYSWIEQHLGSDDVLELVWGPDNEARPFGALRFRINEGDWIDYTGQSSESGPMFLVARMAAAGARQQDDLWRNRSYMPTHEQIRDQLRDAVGSIAMSVLQHGWDSEELSLDLFYLRVEDQHGQEAFLERKDHSTSPVTFRLPFEVRATWHELVMTEYVRRAKEVWEQMQEEFLRLLDQAFADIGTAIEAHRATIQAQISTSN